MVSSDLKVNIVNLLHVHNSKVKVLWIFFVGSVSRVARGVLILLVGVLLWTYTRTEGLKEV